VQSIPNFRLIKGSRIVKQKVGRNDPLLTVYDGEMSNQIKSIIILNNY